MSEFGLRIHNIPAGMIYEVNLGVRDFYESTMAMLNNSLFSYFMASHGLKVHNGDSTRDIICLDFSYGSKTYEDTVKRLTKLYDDVDNDEEKSNIQKVIDRAHKNKDLYHQMSRGEIRDYFYNNGVDVTYTKKNEVGEKVIDEKIHYKMLYRTPAKAKVGQVMFIREELYELAYDWLTMSLGKKMTDENAKIVEMSAYAPLTTSTIVGTLNMNVDDILILKDQDSFFKTMVNAVKAEEYEVCGEIRKKCVVIKEEEEVKNTLWDGMGLIETSEMPKWANGMILVRNHMYKVCLFRTNIQLFFKDWCKKTGNDYETYTLTDMFGHKHLMKDIKVITTDNAIKWKKFYKLMGNTMEEAYNYWCDRIRKDGNIWGIVKTDHPSKLGDNQQMSYQMVNSLPCGSEEVNDIVTTTVEFVEKIKSDPDAFNQFLKDNANESNCYSMLSGLYEWNNDFANSKFFKDEKGHIINQFVYKLRKGKIIVNADNLTICGSPYALLLYSVGEDFNIDPSFENEPGTIQCYTKRFKDNEYLAAFRSPQNSPNNICYLHNKYSDVMNKYFEFSNNIIAVNVIHTDIQDRGNGLDFDSDFFFVTNQPTIVKAAKKCYEEFPTIVNQLQESGIVYTNKPSDYALMDNRFSRSRIGIGYSSNLAQLAMTYYWTEVLKENPNQEKINTLYDNFIILSVVAQLQIDSCKRLYEIDGNVEIDRIANMPCMSMTKTYRDHGELKEQKVDFPEFFLYTREIQTTKNGKPVEHNVITSQRNKLKKRINYDLICPMNYLNQSLDKIKRERNENVNNYIPTDRFFIKHVPPEDYDDKHILSKVFNVINSFIQKVHLINDMGLEDSDYKDLMILNEYKVLSDKIQLLTVKNIYAINKLIGIAMGIEDINQNPSFKLKYNSSKHNNIILRVLYSHNSSIFLGNFRNG